jgi:hypothetical protein
MSGVSPIWTFAPPRLNPTTTSGPDGGVEIVVGKGRVENFVAVMGQEDRFHTAWSQIKAVGYVWLHQFKSSRSSVIFLDGCDSLDLTRFNKCPKNIRSKVNGLHCPFDCHLREPRIPHYLNVLADVF